MSIPLSRLPALLLALTCVITRASAESAAPDLEERLRRLESTVQDLRQENASLRRELGTTPAKTAAADSVLAPAGREARLIVGGYLHAQAEFGDEGDARFAGTNDRFYFRRARMFLAGRFAEQFEFKVEGEFASNSLTPATGVKASANEIYVGWTRFPVAAVRFGQLKPAFGGEQLQIETRSPSVERYLGNDRLTDSRQLGMSVGGDLIPSRLSYLVVVGNGNGPNNSANDNSKFMQTARISGVPLDSPHFGRLTLGTNVMRSDDDAVVRPGFRFDAVPGGALDNTFAGRRRGWGIDAMWHLGLLDFTAELLRMRFEPRNQSPSPRFTAQGWELMGTYYVVPQTLQALVRRESFDPNTNLSGDQTNNWVVGLNYFIKGEDLKLMVDYLFGHEADRPHDHGRLLTRMQVLF